jgi:heterodisulfide reductase subunit A-like polyferredoxin
MPIWAERQEESIPPWTGRMSRPICKDLVRKVYQHPLIHVYTDAVITEATGYVGNFETRVTSERGHTEIKHGAAVIAVGAEEYKPTEYLYGEDDRVMTHLELGEPGLPRQRRNGH